MAQDLTRLGTGQFIVHQVDLTIDQRNFVASGFLYVTPGASGEVVSHLRVQLCHVIEVNDVDICLHTGGKRTPVI